MTLKVENLDAYYGAAQALRGFSIAVEPGTVVCLLGRNGVGKTTALKSIMGLVETRSGTITLDGTVLSDLPAYQRPRHGIAYVPQGRRLFTELTVRENLEIGMMTRGSGKEVLERALGYFPVLKERMEQRSGTLSGGEQTMLTMARALCISPTVIMLDEPTEGLMPSMIATIRDVVRKLRDDGAGILLVEQRVDAVLPVADRIAFMESGSVRQVLGIDDVRGDPSLMQRYLGVNA